MINKEKTHEVMDELEQLIYDEVLTNFVSESIEYQKKILKPYKPKNNTISTLGEVNEKVFPLIKEFSPFRHGELYNKNPHIELFTMFFPFKAAQIIKLEETTKLLIIEKGLEGLKKTFRQGRDEFLSPNALFEDTFMKERLKYLVENEEEPKKVFSEEDYLFIETHLMSMMENALKVYFLLKVPGENNSYGLSKQTSIDLIMDFNFKLITRFEKIGVNLYEMSSFLEKKILKNDLTEEDISNYHDYKICPLTHDVSPQFTGKYKYHGNGDMYKLIFICEHMETMEILLSKENKAKVEKALVATLENIKKMIELGKKENKTVSTIFTDNSLKLVIKFIQSVPLYIK